MAFGIIGKKVGMTQLFTADGTRFAVTVIEAGPCPVLQKKTKSTDGYDALQLGYEPRKIQWASGKKAASKDGEKPRGTRKFNSVTRPMYGHFKHAGRGAYKYIREFRFDQVESYDLGQDITLKEFNVGEAVTVTGTSKGKGFQGVVRKFHFRGGNITHGSRLHRLPGSIGNRSWPGRTFKNKKLPGQMGNHRVTVKNLYVFSIDHENNLIFVRGAVPGPTNGVILLKKTGIGTKPAK